MEKVAVEFLVVDVFCQIFVNFEVRLELALATVVHFAAEAQCSRIVVNFILAGVCDIRVVIPDYRAAEEYVQLVSNRDEWSRARRNGAR